LRGVSKDGSGRLRPILRDAAKRPLLRMRTEFFRPRRSSTLNFCIPYPRPENLTYPDLVLSSEGPLSRSDPELDRAKAGRTGAPRPADGLVAKVERREALRPTSLGARGCLAARGGSVNPASGVLRHCTLAPPAAPPPRAVREGLAKLGRIAPREREAMSVIPGRLRPCASEPGIQTLSSEVQHLWIPGSRIQVGCCRLGQ
jgi:hypothetical protein